MPIADDFRDNIAAVTIELYGADTRGNRRKIYRQLHEVPPDQRLRGIFKVGGKICCVPSVIRADLTRRAVAETATNMQRSPWHRGRALAGEVAP
jgi:hypothetical protein